MKRTYLISIICCLIFGFSCQNDNDLIVSEVYSSDPVFTFSAFSDGENFDIAAGVNDFYMFTDYEIDTLNTFTFISTFAQLSTCDGNCNETLTVIIRDAQESISPINVDINAAVPIGEYQFGFAQGLDFSDVIIEYTDREGITYRTDILDQNAESFFEIISNEDYIENENGDPTKILDISFNCRLKDTESDTQVALNNATGRIGVAYPK